MHALDPGTANPARADPALSPLLEFDARIAKIGSKVRVLSGLAWPVAMEARFLERWRAGSPEMPAPPTQPVDHAATIEALDGILPRLDRGHPIGDWLYKTAWSYRVAALMLSSVGTPRFTECSALLYGHPATHYRSQDATTTQSAAKMLEITDQLIDSRFVPDVPYDIPAPDFAARLRERIDPFFTDDPVQVVLDPELASKAAAGSKVIRIRADAMFSDLDLDQLVEHEAFIHSATMLNGKHQPWLRCLGTGAPRTTRTQEGLATFSEIITGAMDINRLRRLALRVLRLQEALAGADFIEVFRAFLAAGQSEVDSYRSAARIFRGGDVRGRVCFTKDGAYLEGLLLVTAFVKRALHENRGDTLRLLFCGRVTLGDLVTLATFRDSGLVAAPRYVPPWARHPERVLATLAFSTAAQSLRLDSFSLQRFTEYEDEVLAEAAWSAPSA
ncbi:flavohemoglobin expression-modulating QEGLA motif protein [Pseudoxanthomonas daejeonensis]|uniref:tyrosine/phenylalanine carboxypeptidase domain-containing protein n=1 Tax=Pseudoxanthomonas daejeonensis TaxID=266062 RepID=UPI001F545BB1|nr:tyrosine/phenylalanine carboxypeptidase domain-containing protein [Pseudoxanthomonas daejeonensis]UNK57830.1 flavohemoglobin expression-modulating QEGLA motif protein [Pseudoxanthomonas daejeonensis]